MESQAGSDAAKPLESAEASIPGTNIRVITGADGTFTLGPLPPGDFRVLIRHKAAGQLRQVLSEKKTVVRGATAPFGDVFVRQNAEIIGRALVDGRLSGNLGSVAFIAGTPWAALIGDDGSYALRSLPESTVRISAFRDGFQPVESADVFARGGVRTTANDMVLSKPPPGAKVVQGSISGTVFLPGKEDASGVKVKVEPMYRKSAMADSDGATTDAAGHFTVPGLEPGVYRLRFTSGDLPSGELANLLVVSGGSQTLEQPVVLVPEDPSSKAEPPSAFEEDAVDAGTSGDDAGTAVGDAGTAGCRTEADCAFGQICLAGQCTSCTKDAECPAGSACRAGKCVRSCRNNDECASGLVCKAGDCVPCAASGECSSPLVCLADTARCGACRTADDCPAGKACFPNGCGACTRDADCGDPTQNLCEAGLCVKGTCRADTDCDPNLSERCVQHQCVGCMQDKDCGAGFLCDATSKKCVAGDCHTSLNCGAGKLCLKNRCSDCTADADCGTGAVCDRGTCFSGSCSTAAECAGSTASPGDRLCTNHQCVDCRSNAECGTGRICDAGRCFTGDCTSALNCGAGKLCVNNHCSDCTADADCGSGAVCDRGTCFSGNCSTEAQCAGTTASPGDRLCSNHQCTDCRSNAECGTGRVCGAGRCFTGDCTSALDCGAGKLCVKNRCSDCTADADCGAGAVCDRGTCFPGTCSTDAQCAGTSASPGDRLCSSHQCVDCRSNVECGNGKVCAAGRCYAGDCTAKVDCPTAGTICLNHTCSGCSADTDCGTNELCDPSTNKCVPGNCRINANCVDPTNAARSKICSAQGFCTNCGTSADCGAGQVCNAGYCIAGNCAVDKACTGGLLCVNNSCQSCTADNQCGTGRLCLSGACVAGDCRTDSNCSGGRLCVQNQCTACSSSVACPTGKICSAGACVFGNCVTTADCGTAGKPGKLCKQNQCVDCSADAECGTDLCVNGTCTPGNCHNDLDCTTSAGAQFCRSNVCTACDTTTNLCGQGQICDQGRCIAGNCSTRADCDKNPSTIGRLCANHQCTACAKDADCGNNQVCANGQCKAGNCTSEAQCTGDGKGGTTPCSSNQCLACANNAACNTNGFAGRVCDAGYCYYGSCVTNGDCTSGKVCQNHVCGSCSTNAQCSSGQVCAAGTCKPGNCVTEADCPTGPAGGAQLCVNNQCTSCSAGLACSPNAQGSRICDKGYCYTGQCTTEADCGGIAGQQGKVCKSYQCVTCSTKADCASGEVCDSTGLCKPGNCVTALDCPANASGGRQFCNQNQCTACTGNGFGQCSSGQICDTGYCYAGNCSPTQACSTGLACINHTCNSCTKNSDCTTGNVCVSGSCKAGNCVTSSDCVPGAGGGLPVCQANYCTPCSGSAPCGSGQICDNGYCFAGNCTPATASTACSAGQVCASHSCGACSTNADCPSGTQCFPGYGCRGCVADADCPSPQACVNFTCTGNCRSNSDCTVAGQICNSFTKTCGGCNTDTDCGSPSSGKICVNSACIVGDCRVDADCASSGATCKNNKCTLFGPQATLTFTSKDGISSFHPQLLYSPATGRIVFGTSNTFPGGRYLVGYDPATNNYWKAPLGLVTGNAVYPAIAGVFPAKGMAPSGEVVLAWTQDSIAPAPNGHMVAYDTGTGQPVATAPSPAGKYLYGQSGTNYVCGTEVNGEVRWYGLHNTGTNLDRPSLQGFSIDGRPVFQPVVLGCNASVPTEAPAAIVCGTDYLFAVCKNGVEWIDYSTGQIYGKTPYPLNSVYGTVTSPALYRAPGDAYDTVINFANRTSDSKWVVSAVKPGAGSPQVFETPVLSPGFSNAPSPIVDGDGNIYILTAQYWTVLDKTGVVRNQAKSSGTPYTGNSGSFTSETAFVDNTTTKTFTGFAQISGAQKFYTFTFDPTTWQLTETQGYLPGQPNAISTFAAGPILATPNGDMWAWGQDTTNNTRLMKLHPQAPATRAAAPAWPQVTGPEITGTRRAAPTGSLCASDNDCGGATGCLMGHCRGSCNASNACSGGKMCQNNVCSACLTDGACGIGNVCMQSVCEPGCRADSGCASGQICWAGKCVTGTCHSDSECVAGQACINGSCVAGPSIRWTAKTTINANSYRNMWPPTWGSDKTMYLPPVPSYTADYYVIPASTPPNRSVAFSTPPLGTSDFIYSMPALFPNLGGNGDMMLFNTKYTTAGSNTAFARVKVAPTLAGTTKLGGNSLAYDTNQDFSSGGAFFKNGSQTVYLAQEKGSTAGALTALDPSNATKLWQVYATPPLSTNCAGPVIGGSGLIYQLCANTTADGFYIRSLDASGTEKGRTSFASNCIYDGPSLPYDVAIVKPKNLPNEMLLAAYKTAKNGAVCNVVGAFDLVGNSISKRWETQVDPGAYTDNVTADGHYAYSVSISGNMGLIDLVSGTPTYFTTYAGYGNWYSNGVLLGADGTAYRVVQQGANYYVMAFRYGPQGETVIWRYQVPSAYVNLYEQLFITWRSGLAFSPEGDLVVEHNSRTNTTGTYDQSMVLEGLTLPTGQTPGLLGNGAWPMYRHDPNGSANLNGP